MGSYRAVARNHWVSYRKERKSNAISYFSQLTYDFYEESAVNCRAAAASGKLPWQQSGAPVQSVAAVSLCLAWTKG